MPSPLAIRKAWTIWLGVHDRNLRAIAFYGDACGLCGQFLL